MLRREFPPGYRIAIAIPRKTEAASLPGAEDNL
jgi:hypothetical protein